ncbi:MAG: hypothetical protein AAFQ51_18570 [Pseudomonadota bacterium]
MARALLAASLLLAAPALAQDVPRSGDALVREAARCSGITRAFEAHFLATGNPDAGEMGLLSATFLDIAERTVRAADVESDATLDIGEMANAADVEATELIDTALNGVTIFIASEANGTLSRLTQFCESLRDIHGTDP